MARHGEARVVVFGERNEMTNEQLIEFEREMRFRAYRQRFQKWFWPCVALIVVIAYSLSSAGV
jgi:hypothetical protein